MRMIIPVEADGCGDCVDLRLSNSRRVDKNASSFRASWLSSRDPQSRIFKTFSYRLVRYGIFRFFAICDTAKSIRHVSAQLRDRLTHCRHRCFCRFVLRWLRQITLLGDHDLSSAIQNSPTSPQLDRFLLFRLETEHVHLNLVSRSLASFPGIGRNSVDLKQD